MGGLAINVDDPNMRTMRERVTVDWNGFLFLLLFKPLLIPRVTKEQLQDKSKEDTFSKGLVLVQGKCTTQLRSSCFDEL